MRACVPVNYLFRSFLVSSIAKIGKISLRPKHFPVFFQENLILKPSENKEFFKSAFHLYYIRENRNERKLFMETRFTF